MIFNKTTTITFEFYDFPKKKKTRKTWPNQVVPKSTASV